MKTKTLIEILERHGTFDLVSSPDPVPTSSKFVMVVEDGKQYGMDAQQACAEAAYWLANRELDAFKFRALVAGLKRRGMGDLYQHIMGEPIP